jgi:hypothetical protein
VFQYHANHGLRLVSRFSEGVDVCKSSWHANFMSALLGPNVRPVISRRNTSDVPSLRSTKIYPRHFIQTFEIRTHQRRITRCAPRYSAGPDRWPLYGCVSQWHPHALVDGLTSAAPTQLRIVPTPIWKLVRLHSSSPCLCASCVFSETRTAAAFSSQNLCNLYPDARTCHTAGVLNVDCRSGGNRSLCRRRIVELRRRGSVSAHSVSSVWNEQPIPASVQ